MLCEPHPKPSSKARGLVDLLAGGEVLRGLLDVAKIPKPIKATNLSGEVYRYTMVYPLPLSICSRDF
jgi:hypothetical protein